MSRLNPHLLRSALAAAVGGLLFGFDTAVIAGTTRALTETYVLSPAMLGLTASMALWGTVLRSSTAGPPADRYGRRGRLQALGVLYIVSALGCAFAWNWYALVFFRLIGGIGIGGSSVVGPMYIAEISPAEKRGRLVGFFQLNLVAGILLAYLSNYLVSGAVLGAAEWRWKLGVAAIPAIGLLIALAGIPQSPRWLVSAGNMRDAREVLARIDAPNPDREPAQIAESVKAERRQKSEPLFQLRYRRPIFLAISLGMFNQLSGINAILYYLNDIFERAGFHPRFERYAGGGDWVHQSGIYHARDDGHRPFRTEKIAPLRRGRHGSLPGGRGNGVRHGKNKGALVWLLVGFIAFFAFSQGAVIWVYLSEVFPNLVRAKGQSLGSFTHWLMNAIVSGVFPMPAARSGAAPFFFFAAMMAVQFMVVLKMYPETAGVSLESMERHITGGKPNAAGIVP